MIQGICNNKSGLYLQLLERISQVILLKYFCRVIQEKKDLQTNTSSSSDEQGSDSKTLEEQVQTLETQYDDCKKELTVTKDKLLAHDLAAKKAISSLKKELTLRVDQVTKMYEECLRERDSLTVKVSQLTEEKQEITKMQDTIDKKMSEMAKVLNCASV